MLSVIKRNTFATPVFLKLSGFQFSDARGLADVADKKDHHSTKFFKNKNLNFLLTNKSYRGISLLGRSILLPFTYNKINWSAPAAVELIKELSDEETVQILYFLKPINQSSLRIDHVIASKIDKCDVEKGLLLSNAYLLATRQPEFRRSVTFTHILQRMVVWSKTASRPQQLILLSYYAGLDSDRPEATKALRCIYERFKQDPILFEKLSIDELSIVCNSWFSNNVIISSRPLLRILEPALVAELKTNGPSPKALPLLKVIRKASFCTERIVDWLSRSILTHSRLNLAQIAHGLALLADQNAPADDQLVDNILQRIRQVQQEPISSHIVHPLDGIRFKDLVRITWALSCIVTKEEHKTSAADLLVPQMDRFLNAYPCEGELIVDFFLSLACLNVYPAGLIERVVTESFVLDFVSRHRSIRQSRLALFLYAATVEAPGLRIPWDLYASVCNTQQPLFNMEKELLQRNSLAKLYLTVSARAAGEHWDNVQCTLLVPHLNIAGLTFNYQSNKIAVEVLDPTVCMGTTTTPNRLLNLKTRLLIRMGYQVIHVSRQDKEYSQENQIINIRSCLVQKKNIN